MNAESTPHTLNITYKMKMNIVNIRYGKTCARKGQATIGHPFPHQLEI